MLVVVVSNNLFTTVLFVAIACFIKQENSGVNRYPGFYFDLLLPFHNNLNLIRFFLFSLMKKQNVSRTFSIL